MIAASSSPLEAFHKRVGTITLHDVTAKHGDFRMGDAGNLFPLLGAEPTTLYLHNDESLFKGDDPQEIPEAGGWVAPNGESSGTLDGQTACELASGKVVFTDLEKWNRTVTKKEFGRLWLFADKDGNYNGEKSDANGRPLVWEIRCTPIQPMAFSPTMVCKMNGAIMDALPTVGGYYWSREKFTGTLKNVRAINTDTLVWDSLGTVPAGVPYAQEAKFGEVEKWISQKYCFSIEWAYGVSFATLFFCALPGVPPNHEWGSCFIEVRLPGERSEKSTYTVPLTTFCISESGQGFFSKVLFFVPTATDGGTSLAGFLLENVTAEEFAADVVNISLPYPALFLDSAVVHYKRVKGDSSLTLDWGDGTTENLSAIDEGDCETAPDEDGVFPLSHDYEEPGGYVITLKKGDIVILGHTVYKMRYTRSGMHVKLEGCRYHGGETLHIFNSRSTVALQDITWEWYGTDDWLGAKTDYLPNYTSYSVTGSNGIDTRTIEFDWWQQTQYDDQPSNKTWLVYTEESRTRMITDSVPYLTEPRPEPPPDPPPDPVIIDVVSEEEVELLDTTNSYSRMYAKSIPDPSEWQVYWYQSMGPPFYHNGSPLFLLVRVWNEVKKYYNTFLKTTYSWSDGSESVSWEWLSVRVEEYTAFDTGYTLTTPLLRGDGSTVTYTHRMGEEITFYTRGHVTRGSFSFSGEAGAAISFTAGSREAGSWNWGIGNLSRTDGSFA